MLNSDLEKQLDATGLPVPGIIARARFFGQRHLVASSLLMSLSGAGGGVIIFAILAGIAMEGRAGLMLIYSALNFSNACMLLTWLLASRRRATTGEIAAALEAATNDERPHLVARLQARLSSRIQTEPLSASQLATIFDGVRSEHGLPGRRREREARDRQRLAERIGRLLEGYAGK